MKKLFIFCALLIISASVFSQVDTVNNGTAPGSGDGEYLYTAFQKINDAITHINNELYTIDTVTASQLLAGDSILYVNDTNKLASSLIIEYVYNGDPYTISTTDTVKFKTQRSSADVFVIGLSDDLFTQESSFRFSVALEIPEDDTGLFWLDIPTGKLTAGDSYLIVHLKTNTVYASTTNR